MKKLVIVLMASILVIGCTSCKINPEVAKIMANEAGLFSAVSWIAYDNPSTNVIVSVSSILDIISEKASNIDTGKTYLETIYPELAKVIDSVIPEKDRPLCKAASLTLLNGIDALFTMHPEWKDKQDFALDLVKAYIDGAKSGLALKDDNKLMIQARNTAMSRAAVLEKKGWFSK